jgi:hypothetical protein
MADIDVKSSQFLVLGKLRFMQGGEPLPDWMRSKEPKYEHLYVIKMIDTDPQNPTCKIYKTSSPTNRQSALNESMVKAAVDPKYFLKDSDFNLDFESNSPSLIAFLLDEENVTFFRKDHPGDVSQVIMRQQGEISWVFRPMWLANATDNKAFSVILAGHHPEIPEMSYSLHVAYGGSSPNYLEIDPKIDNDGEG